MGIVSSGMKVREETCLGSTRSPTSPKRKAFSYLGARRQTLSPSAYSCHSEITKGGLMPEEPVRSFAYIEEVRLVVVLLDQAHNLMSPSHDEVTTFD
jgi:hypothetical protein